MTGPEGDVQRIAHDDSINGALGTVTCDSQMLLPPGVVVTGQDVEAGSQNNLKPQLTADQARGEERITGAGAEGCRGALHVDEPDGGDPTNRKVRRSAILLTLLERQNWGNVFVFFAAGIPLLVVYLTADPNQRIILANDPTISYPYMGPDTIPMWVAGAIPFVMLMMSVVVVELVVRRKEGAYPQALAATIHFVLDAVVMGITTLLIFYVFKLIAGRLRPDFLARCNPDPNSLDVLTLTPGATAVSVVRNCLNPDKLLLEDGRQSFPSGHSTASMMFAWYDLVYCVWAIYFRTPVQDQLGWLYGRRGSRAVRNVKYSLLSAMGFCWVLVQVAFALGIGVSRFTDNRHNISDVVGGWYIGTVIPSVFIFRAIGWQVYWDSA